MKRLRKAIFLILLGLCLKANASHIVGGEFQMVHINGLEFKVNLIIYFDLIHGNPGARDFSVTAKIFRNSDGAFIMDVPMPLVNESGVDYIQLSCGNDLVKISELTYSTTLLLQPDVFNDPSGYYIAWERCCRNYDITNIYSQDPSAGGIGAGQTFFLQFPPIIKNNKLFVNSSPKIKKPFADYTCVGYPYFADYSAQDADGDSLVYSITTPLSTQTTDPLPVIGPKPYPLITWQPSFDLQNVMGNNTHLNINSDGLIKVTPIQQGLFAFAVLCEEYRNGEKIGEVRREFQILAMNCPTQTAPVISARATGGTYSDLPLEVHFASSVTDGERCIQVKVGDVDVVNSAQSIRISAIPLGFDANMLGILPSTTTATLTQGAPFAEFSICFNQCPPTVSNTFQVGIIAFDASCAVPLSDTVRINVTIEVLPGYCQQQKIHFSDIEDKTLGDQQFSLDASSTSSLPITYSSSDNSVVKVSTSIASLLKPGLVSITASQLGDEKHLPANPVQRKFCVNPEPPVLSLSADGAHVVIQSSSDTGNLWYRDGVYQSDLTESSVTLTTDNMGHVYTVRLLADNCLSNESDPMTITGIEDSHIRIFPNPVIHDLYLGFPESGESVKNIKLSGVTGQVILEREITNENSSIDLSQLKPGIYLLTVREASRVIVRKIYKK